MKPFTLLAAALLAFGSLTRTQAQVVSANPVFFTENTSVTLTYDASQGNGALNNFGGNVYIWTGTVTNLSPNNTTWRNVKSPSFTTADPAALMTRSSSNPNIYTITFVPRTFYPVPANENILRLGMIFKDAAGTVVGRNSDGSDVFVDVYQAGSGQAVRITNPAGSNSNPPIVAAGAAVTVSGSSAQAATLALTLNGAAVASQPNTTSLTATVNITQPGRNVLRLTAGTGVGAVSDSAVVIVRPAVTTAALPAGAAEGITYLSPTSVILALTAPNKQFVYAIGEFNNFQPTNAALMNRTPDGNTWWVQLGGLAAGREYAYQYLVDGNLRVADPYCEKVLDPNNDRYIPAVTYPNLRAYPAGQNAGIVSVFQTSQPAYVWQTTNYVRPARKDLVVYELHMRDFIARHDFQTLRDTLGYLQRLGVNCVELMPVNEFEGNDSWGYNPSFYFAPDKYYGTKAAFKQFIDEAHRRGMAVVMDMVLNHSCGQSPMVQLYFDNGNPATTNPWYNRTATHPFNVCYDFNHESPFTKRFAKNVMDFWVNEYRVDGYRFDLSKGFTQFNSGNNVGLWGNYDQSRINIWLDYYNHMQANRAGTYAILEHFADNSEETVLANAGLMLWGNHHYDYSQAGQGRGGNFNGAYYQNRGWQQPGLVAYMESHDEERNMVDVLTNGLTNGTYSTRKLHTALDRMAMNGAFFFTIPGPKMLWEFEELGYDLSINTCQNGTINNNCRTGAKPIRWRYFTDSLARRALYQTYANLIALKKRPAFSAGTYSGFLSGSVKVLHVSDPALNVTAVGNFGVAQSTATPAFQHTGRWYNYLTGDSISVAGVNDLLTLQAGQYGVYVDRRLRRPVVLGTRTREAANVLRLSVSPNPATADRVALGYTLPEAAEATLTVQNMLGQNVYATPPRRQPAGPQAQELNLATLPAGVYLVRLQAGELRQTTRLVVQR